MITEERHLERQFGDEFREWANKVPAFFPLGSSEYQSAGLPFSLKMVLQREYNGLLAMVTGFIIIAVVRRYSMTGVLHISTGELLLWGASLLITFVLRFLKKRTTLLNTPDR